jgi:hypothetical protein
MENNRLSRAVLTACALCLGGFACTGPSENREILDREKLIEAYVALLQHAPAEVRDTSVHEVAGVLKELGVTEEQVRRSVEEYGKDPARWKEFYQEVVRRLEAETVPKPDSGRVTRRDPAQPQAVPFGR